MSRRIVRRPCVIPLAAWVCLVVAFGVMTVGAQAPSLVVERRGDRLHLSAPRFHLLEGRPLERLRNGSAVPFVFTVTIAPAEGGGRWLHERRRVVISYDLWEEKFAVVLEGSPPRAASHLSAAAAEAWCLDALGPALRNVPAEKPFVVKLDCSVVTEPDPQPAEGVLLSTLIDILSRKGATAQPRWQLQSVPLRLVDLKDAPRR